MVIESATGFFSPGKKDVSDVQDFGGNNNNNEKDQTSEKSDNSVKKETNGTYGLENVERSPTLQPIETLQTTYEQPVETKLYQDGVLVKQPAPTRDPKDPMNLSLSRKLLGIFCLSMFGALVASAEIILGALLPVFEIVYSQFYTVDDLITQINDGGFPEGQTPLVYLEFLGGPPIFDTFLLSSLPILVIGCANLFLVPLAIAVGRRPVIIITGLIALGGQCWAGSSTSLPSHIGARCVQALGAGTVESLIPFIIQDTVYVHQRNTWISAAFACQGLIIIAIGFSAPFIVENLSWRWIYYITAICASAFLVGIMLFLPETRWSRTRSEMAGVPRDDAGVEYTPRTWKYDLALFQGKPAWKKGAFALLDTLRTFFYPQIFLITMLNSVMISTAFAASYLALPALITKPWSWEWNVLGLTLVPVLIAAIAVAVITGVIGDRFSNWAAKRRGRREPENQLINLVLPAACGIIGTALIAVSGEYPADYSWAVFLAGIGFVGFGFLGTNSVGAVYVLECYPHLAGPALVNIASFRCIIAFFLTFYCCDWLIDLGYLKTFMIYCALIAGFSLFIPVVYFYGPAWRKRWPATNLGRH